MAPRALVAVLALVAAPLARADSLECEFTDGSINVAVLNAQSGNWTWTSPARTPAEFYKGVKAGSAFWFMRATHMAGQVKGTMAGTFTKPASDAVSVQVVHGPGFVAFVDAGGTGSSTLTVATERGRDGHFAASFNRTTVAAMLMVQQYWGSCW